MGELVDFKAAQNAKTHARKEAKLNEIKGAFKAARVNNESKQDSVDKLKGLFKSSQDKNSHRKKTGKPTKKK